MNSVFFLFFVFFCCISYKCSPDGTVYVSLILDCNFSLSACLGHGPSVERWTEEDCPHLPSSHCRQDGYDPNELGNQICVLV